MTLNFSIPPSLNGLFPDRNNGRGRGRSKQYEQWIHDAGWELRIQHPPQILGPVELEYIFEEAATKADLGNLEKACTDLLVSHRVIEGDSQKIVRRINMRWGLGVKGVAVTVINLRPMGG